MDTGERETLCSRLWGRFKGQPVRGLRAESAAQLAPRDVINDATSYGVQIHTADVAPGTLYWQAVKVHHLTPEENGGNHHIYLDVFDPTLGGEPYGGRVQGARLRVTWDGGEQIVTVDKPANEPGTNFPMWKWQVCAVECLGLSGQDLPSDRVTGMHTGHPDEGSGNTLFHHSFHVTFVKTQAATQVYTDSVIYGVIHNAAGRTAVLTRGGTEVARQSLGADEAYRFEGLGAAEYVIGVEGTDFRSTATQVNGRDQVQLNLTLVLKQSAISGKVQNGAGREVALLKETTEVARQTVAEDETYRFADLAAGVYRVSIPGTQVVSGPLTVNGTDQATADLVAPAADKPLEHYVLFGSVDLPATRANLLLAQDYLLAFAPAFGFSAAEAQSASAVTIIAKQDEVGAEVEQQLVAAGASVQRIAGTAEAVAAALAARISEGRAFGD